MDLRTFAVEETGVLHLVSASDEPLHDAEGKPLTVTLYGPGSRHYARAQAVQQNRMIDKLKRKGASNQTAEEKAREQAEFFAMCTKEFSANIEYEGLSGDALFKAVYSDTSIGFIAEQVGKYLGDWSNFTKGSSKV